MNAPQPIVTSDPQRRDCLPCVRDLRIGLNDVLGWLAQGQTPEKSVAEYPELGAENGRVCRANVAEHEVHEVRMNVAV